jgi:hypothetical protein
MALFISLLLSLGCSGGLQGIDGAQGEQGISGPKGEQGIQGSLPSDEHLNALINNAIINRISELQGDQGERGPEGSRGTQGLQGIIGERGPEGEGVQGIQGIQGDQGQKGNTGTSSMTVAVTKNTESKVLFLNNSCCAGVFTPRWKRWETWQPIQSVSITTSGSGWVQLFATGDLEQTTTKEIGLAEVAVGITTDSNGPPSIAYTYWGAQSEYSVIDSYSIHNSECVTKGKTHTFWLLGAGEQIIVTAGTLTAMYTPGKCN